MGQNLMPLWEKESNFLMALYDMEHRGILIDQALCQDLSKQADEAMTKITDSLGFKPSETSKLNPFLLDELKLPVLKRSEKTGKPSFDKSVMEEYDLMLEVTDDKRAREILEFRGWQKASSSCYNSYLKLVSPDGRLRTSFKPFGTITGRLSSEKPNLQQIPRQSDYPWNGRVKECFIPRQGFQLWEFDYKTLEFRIAALYSGEPELIARINAGQDLHQAVVDMIFKVTGLVYTRQTIKTTNFLKLYGGGINKLALQLKIKNHIRDDKECVCESCKINAAWNKTFPQMRQTMYDAARTAADRKWVEYWSGRRKHYGTRWNRGEEHKAFNALCQGGGAEVVKTTILSSKSLEIPGEAEQLLTVHDSVLWEIKDEKVELLVPQIRSVMEDFDFAVDLSVDAKEWGLAA
jgi:DNA polymerase-1